MPDYKWSPGALLTITITEKGLRDLREAIAKAQGKEREDPEKELRALWDKWGIPKEKQDEIIREAEEKAKPGAMVGPFKIPE
jgi:hypothetical protein